MVYAGESCIEYLPIKHKFIFVQAGVSCKWANDTQCFLLEHFDAIYHSPSQIYHSALPLSPSSSWIHKCYSEELSGEVGVVKGLPVEWGICFRTVILDSSGATSLAAWEDTIAVGLGSGEIITLNATTGSQTVILSGHVADYMESLTFSSDGISLVSGGCDTAIKLWDL